jgi:hypothetical protein
MALTDISGIGAKTAEKLREDGVTSKQELFRRFKNRDSRIVGGPGRSGLNKRALSGIREALTEQGEQFVDPVYNIPVTEENEQARSAFDLEPGSDVAEGFGSFTRENPSYQNTDSVLSLAGEAIKGDLGAGLRPQSYEELANENDIVTNEGPRESDPEGTARKEAFEFGLDAAANLSPFDRTTIEKGNELSQQTAGMGSFTVQQTETTQREVSDGTIEAEENISVGSRDYARAQKQHMERSPEARRVDNQRKAPVTGNYEKWSKNPDEFDYPSVDTPGGRQDIVTEDQREQASQIEQVVSGADEGVTDIAFGNPLRDMF